jgi:DNA-binding XRE family transcriptional regulator
MLPIVSDRSRDEMARGRSQFAELVGEWITARRSQLGLTQGELAARVGTSLRTVGNVERGTTAVDARMRPHWESALGWPGGSLTAAYMRGLLPTPDAHTVSSRVAMLDQAGIPGSLENDPTIASVLASGLPDSDKVALLRVYRAQREVFDRAFSEACKDAGIGRTGVVQR